jgi:hypothetical protein
MVEVLFVRVVVGVVVWSVRAPYPLPASVAGPPALGHVLTHGPRGWISPAIRSLLP